MLAPNRKPYATADGFVCALMYTDAHWKAFLALIDEPERFESDARFTTQSERITHSNAIYGFVQQHMPAHSTAHWLSVLAANDIPVMPMMKLDDLLTDPHLVATGAWLDVEHPHEGRLRQLRPPVRMGDTPTSVFRPAPLLGEHTQEVLASLHSL
jgi:crotonobetainyl-CoA:carnitine CoA-transferase CaiB-like acyl-CoA transferase